MWIKASSSVVTLVIGLLALIGCNEDALESQETEPGGMSVAVQETAANAAQHPATLQPVGSVEIVPSPTNSASGRKAGVALVQLQTITEDELISCLTALALASAYHSHDLRTLGRSNTWYGETTGPELPARRLGVDTPRELLELECEGILTGETIKELGDQYNIIAYNPFARP